MPDDETTHQKALSLNLDTEKYGVVAEIGAGQEVARWFFRVGATAGTIAKTVSAYDMTMSNELYGKSSRYVARDRLDAMLDYEYGRLIDRLAGERGAETTFFAFADTISARNYHGTNVAHGWMGIRFQTAPGGAPSTVRLHLALLDDTNPLQQQAVGVLGVNLIHSAFFHHAEQQVFLAGLVDALSLERLEVDHIDVVGPAFDRFPSDLGPSLIGGSLARAVAWSPESETLDPMSTIYGRPIVIERGSFAQTSGVHETLMTAALEQLEQEPTGSRRPPVGLYELSLANPGASEPLSPNEAERRLAELRRLGRPILLTRLAENFHVTSYLKRFTKAPIRFAVGLSQVVQVFHEAYYTALDGGVLGAFAELLSADVKFYVLPGPVTQLRSAVERLEGGVEMWSMPESGLARLENTEPTTRLRHLYRYMIDTGAMITVEPAQPPRPGDL